MRFYTRAIAALMLAAGLLSGCGAVHSHNDLSAEAVEAVPMSAEAEWVFDAMPVPMASAPEQAVRSETKQSAADLGAVANPEAPAALPLTLVPEAPGTNQTKNGRAVIDYSNTAEGYVMVQFTGATQKRLKVQVAGPTTTYTYDLTVGEWEVFPLSDGNGTYKVTVFENVTDCKYTVELSASFAVELKDAFGPYLYPNQYVDYSAAVNAVAKAAELVRGKEGTLEQVFAVYDYVVRNLSYDYAKAASVTSGYLPVLDSVLQEGKGICFDYASLMAGMLRSQGIPCKLVVGYAGKAYHAWISVWTEESGWVDGVIHFDGVTWKRMDPTFASSSKRSTEIMAFIGNDVNYTVKYLY